MSGNFEDLIVIDTRANQPSAGQPGRLYQVSDEGIVERDNGSSWDFFCTAQALSTFVLKSLFDANTILAANLDDTPAALTIGEATMVGRQTGGNIAAIAEASSGEQTAGIETALRAFSPADIANMVGIHSGGVSAGIVLLEQHTASASATLDFTSFISSLYDHYIFEFINILPANNAVKFLATFSTDGGSSWIATNYLSSYTYLRIGYNTTGVVAGATTSILLSDANANTSSAGTICGTADLFGPGAASYKEMLFKLLQENSGAAGTYYRYEGGGMLLSTSAINAVRFAMSAGNIAYGTIRVYGVVK